MKRGLRIHNQIYIRQVHEVKLLTKGEYIWMVSIFLSPFFLVFISSRLLLYPFSPFLLFPLIPLPLHPFVHLSSPGLLPPAGFLLHHPLGGYRHLRFCPALFSVVAAWTVLPPSAAKGINPFYLTINCYTFSHDRGIPLFIFMSIPSLILSHGFSTGLNLDSVIFLQVVDEIGRGNLQVISQHGQPFFRAGIEESQAQFSLCQYRHPSEPWEIDF